MQEKTWMPARGARIALVLSGLLLAGAATAAGIAETRRDPAADGVAEGDWVRFDLTSYSTDGKLVDTTVPALAQEAIAAGSPFFPDAFNASLYVPFEGRIVLPREAPGGPALLPKHLLGARPGGVVVRTPPIANPYGELKSFTFRDTIGPIPPVWTVDLHELESPKRANGTRDIYGDTSAFAPGHRFLLARTRNTTVVGMEGREATLRVEARTGERVYSAPLGLNLAVEVLPDGRLVLRTHLQEGDVFRADDCKTLPLPIDPGTWRVTAIRGELVTVEPAYTPEQQARYVGPLVFELRLLDAAKGSWTDRVRALAES